MASFKIKLILCLIAFLITYFIYLWAIPRASSVKPLDNSVQFIIRGKHNECVVITGEKIEDVYALTHLKTVDCLEIL